MGDRGRSPMMPIASRAVRGPSSGSTKEGEAPIFELVDFGVAGDPFTVLPQATDEVRKRKG